ncbi:hypothetical protein [Desulfocurvus sp.]|uniref:hypothetical protein n=1 Tax=Desulfocurvus sp. TaxID=2871698 RepID=UPI0025BB81B6|nr:hypothetical protein [Desulfocurvus sp.]MCK9239073.1 hypothetical protein [Desulfocurvus sp.]
MNVSDLLHSALHPALAPRAASLDRSFLGTVQDRFSGTGLTPELLRLLLLTVAAAAAVGALVYLLNLLIAARRRGAALPTGTVQDPAEIRRLLDMALTRRSRLDLSFSRTPNKDQGVSCSIEQLRDEHLVVEITARIDASQRWIGRTVHCYVRITAGKERTGSRYYFFDAEIAGLSKQADGSLRLTLTLPTVMRLQQKRIHLRLDPPTEFMLGLALWPEPTETGGSTASNIRSWGRPALLFHPARRDLVRVVNVSAGGMRLDVTRKALRETGLEFEPGQRYILLTEIYDPDRKAKRRLWCLARVQNRFEDFETRNLEIGMSFVGQGLPAGQDKNALAWKPLGEDGIAFLGDWVVKRHLERYRKGGGAQ